MQDFLIANLQGIRSFHHFKITKNKEKNTFALECFKLSKENDPKKKIEIPNTEELNKMKHSISLEELIQRCEKLNNQLEKQRFLVEQNEEIKELNEKTYQDEDEDFLHVEEIDNKTILEQNEDNNIPSIEEIGKQIEKIKKQILNFLK